MPRKKIKHVKIQDEKLRKSTLQRRVGSFLKKADELSVLCGCEVFIILLDMIDGVSTLWPSTDAFNRGFEKFMNIPEHDRLRKMVMDQDFLMELVREATQNLMKLRKKNNEIEMGYLVNQLIHGKNFNEIDVTQMDGLNTYIEENIKKLEIRQDKLMQGPEPPTNDSVPNDQTMSQIQGEPYDQTMFQKPGGEPYEQTMFQMPGMVSDDQTTLQIPGTEMVNPSEGSGGASTSVSTLMEDLKKDRWFIETMCGFDNNFDF